MKVAVQPTAISSLAGLVAVGQLVLFSLDTFAVDAFHSLHRSPHNDRLFGRRATCNGGKSTGSSYYGSSFRNPHICNPPSQHVTTISWPLGSICSACFCRDNGSKSDQPESTLTEQSTAVAATMPSTSSQGAHRSYRRLSWALFATTSNENGGTGMKEPAALDMVLGESKSAVASNQKGNGRFVTWIDGLWPRKSSSYTRQSRKQWRTLLRVVIPSILSGVVSYLLFPAMALALASCWSDPGVFSVLSQDSSQFVQNFLSVSSLLFSILVGQTYYFLYTQQESIYYALFSEVTEAKSLLEQVALVCQGRSMYPRCLQSISRYVQDDLKQIQCDPAILLSARPVDDPLESIMYMTSVGVPSTVYETVKSLREARARRLGALQRKLPSIHMFLLWILAAIELVSFPLLGAGTQTLGGYHLLTIEGILFGVMTGGIVLTLRIVGELWRPAGGAYNVDAVLSVMVRGLEEELRARMAAAAGRNGVSGTTQNPLLGSNSPGNSNAMAPSGARDVNDIETATALKQTLARETLLKQSNAS